VVAVLLADAANTLMRQLTAIEKDVVLRWTSSTLSSGDFAIRSLSTLARSCHALRASSIRCNASSFAPQ
jgi:hypothetical protein